MHIIGLFLGFNLDYAFYYSKLTLSVLSLFVEIGHICSRLNWECPLSTACRQLWANSTKMVKAQEQPVMALEWWKGFA